MVLTLVVLAAGVSRRETRAAALTRGLRGWSSSCASSRRGHAAAPIRRRSTIWPRALARLETVAGDAEAAGRRHGAGQPHRDARRRMRALGERVGVLARRNDEIASIAGEARTRADAVAASLADLRKAQPPAGVGRAARRDRGVGRPHRRARAPRQGDRGAARRARRRERQRPFAAAAGRRQRAQRRGRARRRRSSPSSPRRRRSPPIRRRWRRSIRSRRPACPARMRWRASSRR